MENRSFVQGLFAVLIAGVTEFLQPLAPFVVGALVLTFVDLRFGIRAARKRGEVIRYSRAVRRTLNKVVDYLSWILLAGVAGKMFGNPLGFEFLPAILLAVVYGVEINSCLSNWAESRGLKMKFNIFKLFRSKVDGIDEVIEEENGKSDDGEQEN